MKNAIQDEIKYVLAFVGVIWAVYFLDFVVPGKFTDWGIVPRTAWGLVGIPLAPFLHGGLWHLVGNTIPLIVLLILTAGSRTRTWPTVAEITLAGGALLWLFGRNGTETLRVSHVGASGLIYGLIAFLSVAGFREKRPVPLIVAILVGFLYGGTLLYGVLPNSQYSWDGHLFGAIAGAALAYFTLGPNSESAPDTIDREKLPSTDPADYLK